MHTSFHCFNFLEMKVKELFPFSKSLPTSQLWFHSPPFYAATYAIQIAGLEVVQWKRWKGKYSHGLALYQLCPVSKGKEENEKKPTCDVKCYGTKPVMKDNRFLQWRVDNDLISSLIQGVKKITLGIIMKVQPILCINAYKNYTFQIWLTSSKHYNTQMCKEGKTVIPSNKRNNI